MTARKSASRNTSLATPVKVFLHPEFSPIDKGDGGIGRVVRSQVRHLPSMGIELVKTAAEADVIACHIQIPDQYLTLYPEKKFVAHCHGLYWEGYKWEHWAIEANRVVMESIRVADYVTSPSEWVSQTLRRATCRDIETVYHGLELDEWKRGSDAEKRYVLFDKTRIDSICEVDSLARIAELLPHIEFISTAGNIDLPNVHNTGTLPFEDAKALTQNAWLYLATTRETFGIGTIQAMACGVPVAGYAFGGQVEICDETNSILTEPDPDQLAIQISLLYDDAERYAAMSLSAQKRAQDFDAVKVNERYAEIYQNVARQRSDARVSVIIPSYNLAQYLPDAIESVVKCLGVDDELIIVDDCSTDGSYEVAQSYHERDRISVIKTPHNLYLSGARNYGIEHAKGRYILPLDADDMLAPHTLNILATELDKDRHTHIAYGNVRFVEPDGREWHSSWPLEFNQEWQSNQRNMLPYCSMYRRTVWESLRGYRSHNRTAEDADFWTRASRYGFRPRMVTKADTLVYRIRTDSMSTTVPMHDWAAWFSRKLPGGASTDVQLPVPALHPPVISVIIPVGPGHEQYVKTAIDSLEAQSFTEWECIVVTDNCAQVSVPSWVRVVPNAGAGVAAARNTGISLADARLILPLDADDYLQPDALQTFYDAYKIMQPDVRRNTVLYSDFWEDVEKPGEYTRYYEKDYNAENLTRGAIHTVTTLFHKSIWERVGGYRDDVKRWEDWAFQLACAEIGICSRRIAAPLFTYRKHTGNRAGTAVTVFEESKADILRVYGKYWEGEKLMACGCQGQQTATIYVEGDSPSYADPNMHQDATLVVYNGNHGDGFTLKGKVTGQPYRISKGEPFYALNEDIASLTTMVGMNVAEIGPELQNQLPQTDAPVLAAVGQ